MMKSPLSLRIQRSHRTDDSGAAMITALLAILVTAMFAIVMLGVLLSQTMPTQLQQATTRTVFAAEAGINVVVGQIRNAQDVPDGTGKIYGKRSLLPCTSTGTVTSGGTTLTYSTAVDYFTKDPTNRDATWRTANVLTCVAGSGPSEDPTHALITSSGTGLTVQNAAGNIDRTIEVVYAFQITNSNIPGGYITSLNPAKPNDPARFCLQASSIAEGANIKYVDAATCTGNDPKQMWLYDSDYEIKLAATTIPSFGSPQLCITGVPNGGTAVRATLEVCKLPTDAARWSQLWSWEGSNSWQGQRDPVANGKSGMYLSTGTAGTVGINSYLYVWNQSGGAEWNSYTPDARVGAGPAGKATNQIVNYYEFGRCADVTGENIGAVQNIVYPCKQDPNPSQSELKWNHKWFYNEPNNGTGSLGPQPITVKYLDATPYCLTSAGAGGGFVTFKTPCNTATNAQQWTRVGRLDSYDVSYLFKDFWGNCLDLGPSYDVGGSQLVWSTLVTKPCTPGALSQKWNAPANVSSSTLGGYWELP